MTDNNSNAVCFGDVIKLSTKSAFATTADDACLGFLEQKSALVLVVPPAKDDAKTPFTEAEFIVSAIRGDKPPAKGTPLSYKQPFVLKTSDGSGYSLNNKTPNASELVSLQVSGIKGEMYVTMEKQGFSGETHVHDGDLNVELVVVDSNRIRKNYNKTLTHFKKNKADTDGGFVSCGGKGPVLSFKIVKVTDKSETRKYVKDPVFRRASQELLDPVKADETSEASVLETPSRAGSIVATAPLVEESTVTVAAAAVRETTKAEEQPQEPVPVVAPVEAVTGPVAVEAVAAPTHRVIGGGSVAKETPKAEKAPVVEQAKTETVVTAPSPVKTATAKPAVDAFAGLSTIELTTTQSVAPVVDTESMDGSAPVHFKIPNASPRVSAVAVNVPAKATAKSTKTDAPLATTTSDVDLSFAERDEKVDTGCIGNSCSVM